MSAVTVNDGISADEKNPRWGKVHFYKKNVVCSVQPHSVLMRVSFIGSLDNAASIWYFLSLTQCTSKLGSSWDMNEWMRIRDEPGIWQQIWFNFSEIKGIDLKDLYHYLLITSLLYLKSLSNGAVSERQFIYFENKVNFVVILYPKVYTIHDKQVWLFLRLCTV